jgi:hypothetical protein
MFSPSNLRDMGERAAATFAQTMLALVGTDATGVLTVNIGEALLASLVAAGLSVLKAVAAIRGPVGGPNASLVDLDD